MKEEILWAFLVLHVLSGAVAAFVAFPIAALATKGSRLHAVAGWTFVGGFFFLCVGGFVLEFEYLKGAVVEIFGVELNVSPFNKARDLLAVINSTMVNVVALYFALSGWRVWRRAQAAEDGRFPIFDSILAIAELVAGTLFMVTLWRGITIGALDHHMSPDFIWNGHMIVVLATAYVFYDAGKDLYIGLAKRVPKAWWRIHARKMVAAEMGLVAAFPYRCVPFSKMGGLLMLVAMLIAFVVGMMAIRRFAVRLRASDAVP